jgi:predicted phage terminase large subunit-like protein
VKGHIEVATATGDKETRAKPVSAQAEAGNVKILRGPWNDSLFRVLENFPIGRHDDEVDALSGAHGILCDNSSGAFSSSDQFHVPPSVIDSFPGRY